MFLNIVKYRYLRYVTYMSGYHYIIELQTTVFDNERIIDALKEICQIYNLNILTEFFHPFSNNGFTGIIALIESHISIHTWPEKSYIALDIFVCTEPLSGLEQHIARLFATDTFTIQLIERRYDT